MSEQDDILPDRLKSPIIPLRMNLKKQLSFYLEKQGMTASALARRAEVPKQSIGGWLSGNSPRDVRQVKRVADVFGVTVDNLLFGDGRDQQTDKNTELDALFGEGWVSGVFEVKLRRVKK